MRPIRILHLSGDYPDSVREPTTKAIKHTIDHLPQFDHVVVSSDRRANPFKTYWVDCGRMGEARVFALGQWGLPLGIGLFLSFFITTLIVRKKLKELDWKPDIIHAHRFSFDGIGAWILSRHYGVPFVGSVRGETESKIFRYKPHYKPLMRKLARDCAAVYYVSVWYRDLFRAHTNIEKTKERILPNIVTNTKQVIESQPATRDLISIFNFEIYKKKGLLGLLPAFKKALQTNPDLKLDLVGQADTEQLATVNALIAEAELSEHVHAIGPIDHAELIERLPTYQGLVLPSHNETFGMVYTEALFAGVPVLYSANTGVDGYLDNLDVGVRVDPNDVDAIADGIVTLINDNAHFRDEIENKSEDLFNRFDPDQSMQRYSADIEAFTRDV